MKTWSDACIAQLKGENITCKTCIHWCAIIPQRTVQTFMASDIACRVIYLGNEEGEAAMHSFLHQINAKALVS